MKKTKKYLFSLLLCICIGCSAAGISIFADSNQITEVADISSIPEYSDNAYVIINNNIPDFDKEELTTESFESYSDLDDIGRCGVAYACIGMDLMPTEDRGDISEIYPSGWNNNPYDFVDEGYVYNRCHLIAYCLTAENANEKNLITGTRYMNVDGMLPFENQVADYIEDTGNHVLYRVTPIFEGNNLVASGVQMEAMSVEDNGDGILFNIYCYNVQPGVVIDYATGENREEGAESESTSTEEKSYILNMNSKKFHNPDCSSVNQMSDKNKQEYTGTRNDLIAQGYEPCGSCNP